MHNELVRCESERLSNNKFSFSLSQTHTQSLLSDFNKEQEQFIKDQSGKSGDAGVCPWVGHKNEDKIKEEVLNLSGVSEALEREIIKTELNSIFLPSCRIVGTLCEHRQPVATLISTTTHHIQ